MVFDLFNIFSGKDRCPNCRSLLHFGTTTYYDSKSRAERCSTCNAVLSKD